MALPTAVNRIWDIDVPIIADEEKDKVTVYITTAVLEPFYYNELCYMLENAKPSTSFHVIINTPGGVTDSAFMIADAIQGSKATVIGYLSGTVASAGTIIAMSCNELVVAPHVSFMIHNYSGGIQGKGHEMKARQKFIDEHLNTAFTHFYSGFLTNREMEEVITGQDMWMGTKAVISRWNNRIEQQKRDSK